MRWVAQACLPISTRRASSKSHGRPVATLFIPAMDFSPKTRFPRRGMPGLTFIGPNGGRSDLRRQDRGAISRRERSAFRSLMAFRVRSPDEAMAFMARHRRADHLKAVAGGGWPRHAPGAQIHDFRASPRRIGFRRWISMRND